MATKSSIEWTESTWNPVTGCTKISAGCANCYAERMAKRLQAMGQHNYRNGFGVTCHDHMLEQPLSWRSPRTIFVNSMSDLFHETIPDAFIQRVFETMSRADWHRFQILTKRAERLLTLSRDLDWSDNIWTGVTVENSDYAWRIDYLRQIPAAVRFVSFEPLLGALPQTNLSGVDWAIVGGESGPGARPMEEAWVLDLQDQCRAYGTQFFFKQWGGVNKKKTGRLLQGRTWNSMPALA